MADATLTIVEEQVVLEVTGAALLEPFVADAARLRDEAKVSADRVAGTAKQIIPFGTATVAGNTATATEYVVSVPAGFEPFANGALVDFIVPADSLGLVFLTIGSVPIREVFMVRGQQLRAGWIVRVQKNEGGGKWNLISQEPQGVDLLEVGDVAYAGLAGLAELIGVPIARTIAGNPNEIYVAFDGWVNDAQFEAYILETNTASPIINLADGRRRAIAECPAGSLVAGTIARFVVSFGIDNVIYRGRRTLPKLSQPATPNVDEDLVLKFVQQLHANQWNLAADHKPVEFVITTAGMSISTEISSGRDGAAVYSISHRITDLFNGYVYDPANPPVTIPLAARVPGTVVIDDNRSRGGKTVDKFWDQLNESQYWVAGTSRAVILNPGPNDWREGNYNVGVTFDTSITIIEQQILANRAKGMMTFLVIPGDPDNSRTDHASFYTINKDYPQHYPYPVSPPVNTETGQYPPASQSIGKADMTGHSVPILFDRRFEHGAAQLRLLAAKYPKCVVALDVRKAFQRVIEAHGSGAYAAGLIFNPPDDIHYLSYMHDRADAFPSIEMVQDALAGRRLKPVYDGSDWRNYGPSA